MRTYDKECNGFSCRLDNALLQSIGYGTGALFFTASSYDERAVDYEW